MHSLESPGSIRGPGQCSDVCHQLLFSVSLNFFVVFSRLSRIQNPISCTHVGLQALAFELCEQPQLLACLPRPFSSFLALSGLVFGRRRIRPPTKKTPIDR